MDTLSVAEIMERDIARLKAARPNLATRISCAEHILVTQLSTANGSRPVKVRVHADGSRSYTVRSGSKLARSYRVSPESWSCECPDQRKRNAACKHAITCWILERAFGPSPISGLGHGGAVAEADGYYGEPHEEPYEERECPGCLDGRIYDAERGVWVECRTCSGSGRAVVYVYPKPRRRAR